MAKKPSTLGEYTAERAHNSLCGRCLHEPVCRMAEAIKGAERIVGREGVEVFVVTISHCYQHEPDRTQRDDEEIIR